MEPQHQIILGWVANGKMQIRASPGVTAPMIHDALTDALRAVGRQLAGELAEAKGPKIAMPDEVLTRKLLAVN